MINNRLSKYVLSVILSISLITSTFIGVVFPDRAYAATGTIYYVDSQIGSDSNDGKSTDHAFKTFSKINGKTNFMPGDQILLKSGCVWNEAMDLKSSGDANNQIIVGMYGGETKPIINGMGGTFAIRMENIQYVSVQDIEITNFNVASPDDYKTAYYRRSGVWVIAHHYGAMKSIQLSRLDIHDVTGLSINGNSFIDTVDGSKGVNKNANAAILVNAWDWVDANTPQIKGYFDNLLIQDNYIHDITTIGVNVDGYGETFQQNVVIKNNTINKTGADGIVVGVSTNPLVEHNVLYDAGINGVNYKYIAGMWCWKTDGAVFQYNEVARTQYENPSESDSAAFDTDILTTGDHIYQYNYSHENTGGFFMDMGDLKNGKNIVRYNISQNDSHKGFTNNTINVGSTTDFYNNVFYNDKGDGYKIIDNSKLMFVNNIFDISGNIPYPVAPSFYCNAFYGHTPPAQGIGNIVTDPKFVSPGVGADGISTINGYKLRDDSPLIGAGRIVDNNGGKDFWGNSLYNGSPDIGAYESTFNIVIDNTPPSKATAINVKDKTDTIVSLSWTAMENNVPLDADIYNASTNQIVASSYMRESCILTGLTPSTDYSFYIIVKDRSGNVSERSDTISVKTTIAASIIDHTQAVTTGTWTVNVDTLSYKDSNYVTSPAGNGSTTITWTPTLTENGYYSVYYWLPNKSDSRATNAQYTVNFHGGSKVYNVNEKLFTSYGSWVLLGTHNFQLNSGSVQLTNDANGSVAADAIKFEYIEGFGLDSITQVNAAVSKLQARIGETLSLSVTGQDAIGRKLDLNAGTEGVTISYTSDKESVATVSNGVVTGKSVGTAYITISVTINGKTFECNKVEVVIGSGFIIKDPEFTDANGNTLISLTTGGVVNTTVHAINSTENKQKVTLIVALYSSKGLVKTSTQGVVLNEYDNAKLSIQTLLPQNISGYYIKTFVWDDISMAHPLSDVTIFPN